MTPPRRALIVGGGPAGASTAFWLAKAGFEVLVAERSAKEKFAYGQGVDITGAAIKVMRKMALEQVVRSSTTGEEGFAMVDDEGATTGAVGAQSAEGGEASLTKEIEIQRGEISKILAETAVERWSNVTYRYDCSISEIRQTGCIVKTVLSDSGKEEEFDYVIGADGLGSKTRKLAFDDAAIKDCYKPQDVYVAFFSIPGDPEIDLPNARIQQAAGGRNVVLRPTDGKAERTSCYMTIVSQNAQLEKIAAEGTPEEQKDLWIELFSDLGGLAPRALDGLKDAEDLYCTRIVQVKLDNWHNGRCVLVGDAAYAPSPLTGEGTTLALVGAYVLAGELAANPENPQTAFTRYREVLKDFVAKSQAIPLGGMAPKLVNPQTTVGVLTLRAIFSVISHTGVWKLFGGSEDKRDEFDLPPYEFERTGRTSDVST